MRLRAKVDANQGEVVTALRKSGWTVHSTAQLGRGFPDLIVACGPFTALLEVKQGKNKLTLDEEEFRAKWPGVYIVARNSEQALRDLERARAEVMG